MSTRFFPSVLVLIGLYLLILSPGPAAVADAETGAGTAFRIIVNAGNNLGSITKDEASRLFLKKSTRWMTGEAVAPVDLRESAVRDAFSQAIHGKKTTAIKSYWNKMIFSGRATPPPEMPESDLIAFVSANPGAIGYVSTAAELGDGVKVVELVE